MRERRQSARLVDSVTFKIAYKDYDIICDTLNLSSNGLLCRINQNIPAMTKIGLALILPAPNGTSHNQELRAKGVVVRSEKEPRGKLYQLAIFFTEMTKTHRNQLQGYIQSRMVEREFT